MTWVGKRWKAVRAFGELDVLLDRPHDLALLDSSNNRERQAYRKGRKRALKHKKVA